MKALGEWLTRTDTTQSALARDVGVSQPVVSNLVNGVHSASSDLLKRISSRTGIYIDDLLADQPLATANQNARAGFHGCTRGE